MAVAPNTKQYTRKKSLLKYRSSAALFILGLPGLLSILIFSYLPMYGLVLPFKNFLPVKGVFGSPWSGFDNFRFLFSNKNIWTATVNTLGYNFTFMIMNTFFGVLFALLLYELTSRAVRVYQTAFFVPFYLSWAIVSLMGMGFLDIYGVINSIRGYFELAPIDFYKSPKYWPYILTVVNTWKTFGYASVIYYASLVSIDSTQFEAAEIDGASKLQKVWYISLPSLIPIIVLIQLLATGRMFYGDIGLFYNVTLTSNTTLLQSSTDVIDTYVLRMLKKLNEVGIASAAGFYQSICGFVLVLITNLTARKISPENSLF